MFFIDKNNRKNMCRFVGCIASKLSREKEKRRPIGGSAYGVWLLCVISEFLQLLP